jgi:Cdc6-like AAA superfamily ATPase
LKDTTCASNSNLDLIEHEYLDNLSESNTSATNIAKKDDHLNEILKYLINLGNFHLDRGHVIIRGNHKTGKTAFANTILHNLEQFIHEKDISKYNLIKLDARETKTKASIYNKLFKFLFSNPTEDLDLKFKSVNSYLRFNKIAGGLDPKMLETDIFVILLDHFELLEDQLHIKHLFDCIRNEAMVIVIVA